MVYFLTHIGRTDSEGKFQSYQTTWQRIGHKKTSDERERGQEGEWNDESHESFYITILYALIICEAA